MYNRYEHALDPNRGDFATGPRQMMTRQQHAQAPVRPASGQEQQQVREHQQQQQRQPYTAEQIRQQQLQL